MVRFKKPRTKIEYIIIITPFVVSLIAAIFLISHFIKTKREIIKDAVYNGAKAVVNEDTAILDKILSERYTGEYAKSKRSAITQAKTEFETVDITQINILEVDIIFIKEDLAAVNVTFQIKGSFNSAIYSNVPFSGIGSSESDNVDKADLKFAREGKKWRVIYFKLYL